jgi:uncharacterized membrane protein
MVWRTAVSACPFQDAVREGVQMESTDSSMLTVWLNVLYLLSRYVHIISAMLLVGGFLFYEMVVPIAIADLRDETQAEVFAKARWAFRWIIWTSVTLLIITGVHLTVRRMHVYIESQFIWGPAGAQPSASSHTPWALQTGLWWAAHVVSAVIAIGIALYLGSGDRPPIYPLGWLRLDLMVLLIVVFFAVATQQVGQLHEQRQETTSGPPWRVITTEAPPEPTTQPLPGAPAGQP